MNAKFSSAGLASVICTVLLTGCAMNKDHVTVGAVPDDYRKRHPIVLTQEEKTLDLAIASTTRSLDRATQSNIAAFAQTFTAAGGGTMVVLEPSGSKNTHAVMRMRDQVIKALMDGGVSRHQVALQTYDASGHGAAAPMRLSYHGLVAKTGECGNWFEDLGVNPENTQYHDFGCPTQSNLAAIIANPNDLMGPRATSSIDAAQRARVIQDWQGSGTFVASEVTY